MDRLRARSLGASSTLSPRRWDSSAGGAPPMQYASSPRRHASRHGRHRRTPPRSGCQPRRAVAATAGDFAAIGDEILANMAVSPSPSPHAFRRQCHSFAASGVECGSAAIDGVFHEPRRRSAFRPPDQVLASAVAGRAEHQCDRRSSRPSRRVDGEVMQQADAVGLGGLKRSAVRK